MSWRGALAPCDHTPHHLPALLPPVSQRPSGGLLFCRGLGLWESTASLRHQCFSLCVSALGLCLLSWPLSNQDPLFPSCLSSSLLPRLRSPSAWWMSVFVSAALLGVIGASASLPISLYACVCAPACASSRAPCTAHSFGVCLHNGCLRAVTVSEDREAVG